MSAILSVGEAQRLTQRIKLTASGVRDGLFRLRALVDEAQSSNAWQVLGFPSWTAYLADTLASEPMRLPREQRLEITAWLAGEGLSTRAIAPIVGVDQATVVRDVRGDANASPEPRRSSTEPRPVVGLDGKQYAVKSPELQAAEAVEEFPDLAYYNDQGDTATVNRLAASLRGFTDAERPERLHNLRLTIAAAQRRDSGEIVPLAPDYRGSADAIVRALSDALDAVEEHGGAETVRRASETTEPAAVSAWRAMFDRIPAVVAELSAASRPVLRSVK